MTEEARQAAWNVELRLRTDDEVHVLVPGMAHPTFDDFLGRAQAEAWVFVATPVDEGKSERKVAKRKKALEEALEGEAPLAGEVRTLDGESPREAGVFLLDTTRERAGKLAKELGAEVFYWGARGAPVEVHPAVPFEDDWDVDEEMTESARFGLSDLNVALRELFDDGVVRFRLIAVVVGTIVMGALAIAAAAALVDASREDPEGWEQLLRFVLRPALLPGILGGLYVRDWLRGQRIETVGRDLTEDESWQLWRVASPKILFGWLATPVAIWVLATSRFLFDADVDFGDYVDHAARETIIGLWFLSAVSYADSFGEMFGALFEAFFSVLLAVFGMKLALMFVGMGADIFWSIIHALLPFSIPGGIVSAGNAISEAGAALALLFYMVGYSWKLERLRYFRWASEASR